MMTMVCQDTAQHAAPGVCQFVTCARDDLARRLFQAGDQNNSITEFAEKRGLAAGQNRRRIYEHLGVLLA